MRRGILMGERKDLRLPGGLHLFDIGLIATVTASKA